MSNNKTPALMIRSSAAEEIYNRANADKTNMGLSHWQDRLYQSDVDKQTTTPAKKDTE